MRSIVLTLVAAATVAPCAFAATPNYTSPFGTVHGAKTQDVFVTFANRTAQERDLHVAGFVYQVRANSSMNLYVAPGSAVRVTSNTNSKVDEILPLTASLDKTTIVLK